MHIAILTEPRRIELREEPVPAAKGGEIVVRVRAALTDGTDLKTYRRGHPQMPMPTRFAGMIISWQIAVLSLGMLVLVGVLTSTYPARRAAELPPVEALRFEM